MRYREEDVKRILRANLETSARTEEKIREAYAFIRADAAWNAKGKDLNDKESCGQDATEGKRQSENTASFAVRRQRKSVPKRALILAAALGVAAASAFTAAALSGVFTKTYEQQGEALTYQFAVNYEIKPVEAEMTASYIPEGYEQEQNGALKWCKDDSWQNGISLALVNASYLDAQGTDSLDVKNLKSLEKTTINRMEAHLLTLSDDTEQETNTFDKRIYLFNEEDGYVAVVYGGNDLPMDELKKVAAGLTFTKTGETVDYVNAEEKQAESEAEEAWKEDQEKIRAYGVPQEYILSIGTTFNLYKEWAQAYLANWEELQAQEQAELQGQTDLLADGEEQETDVSGLYDDGGEYKAALEAEQGIDITVESAELLDSIADYDTAYFVDYEDRIAENLNEDGTAKTYTRITCDADTGEEIAKERTENVERKFLKVTIKAQNMGEETVDFWAGEPALAYLTPQDGNYAYAETSTQPLSLEERMEGDIGSPIYFDQSPYAREKNSAFFYREMEADETLEYTLLYVVDADRLSNLYLTWGQSSGDVMELDGSIYKARYVALELPW